MKRNPQKNKVEKKEVLKYEDSYALLLSGDPRKSPNKADDIYDQAEGAVLKCYKQRYHCVNYISPQIVDNDLKIKGVVDGIVKHGYLERFEIQDEFIKKGKETDHNDNFFYYMTTGERKKAFKYLPGTLRYNPSLIEQPFVTEIITSLQSTAKYGEEEEAAKAEMLLEDIGRALKPGKKSGRKPKFTLEGWRFLEILQDWKEIEGLIGKHYKKPNKKNKIRDFYKINKGLNVEDGVIKGDKIRDIVLNVHLCWGLHKYLKKELKFETLKDNFEKTYRTFKEILTLKWTPGYRCSLLIIDRRTAKN